jgi:hypothetical protein
VYEKGIIRPVLTILKRGKEMKESDGGNKFN